MEFNKAYCRDEFLSFLRVNFLPEDFNQEISTVENPVQFQYTQQVTRLGECESLGLVVYEVCHSSKHDARVGLTKEAFRLLADEFCERALVFFVPEDDNSNYRFSLIEITLDQSESSSRVSRRYSNPHRYSYYLGKGIAYYTPNKYLNEYGRVVSVEDLRNRFSVDVLTKAFYQELSDWYAWAIMVVRFPNDLKTLEDNQKYNSEAMIRLITRLIFVWFLKQRHLVPDEFFDEQFIADELIQGFTPHAIENLFGKSYESKYYKGVLQNLFFAMLNSPITPEGKNTISERRFRNGRGDYDNNKLMRHEDLFINPAKFVELANKYVPFLNGGLFDCLDDKDKGIYIDAFTDRKVISDQLVIPDFLFFGDEVGKNIDLSEWYGDKKKKKVSARGIIDILKRYNFTVEENTPFDQEVSLDPELLGKVFENLLAAYNPETQTTARKQTGSFYTPREIVQYMVDESLIAHLKRTVGEDLEPEYRKLLQYTDEVPNLTDEQKKQIMQSLYHCKVLDPACGSGAFPMGMLQQMVHILNRIDPNNEQWKEMMLNNAISETSDAYRTATDEERAEIVADIERSFNESINRPDYARKLYLIENCIYGVDIQPIAIQISKLRFFISLVVDQKTNDNPVDNFGIRPLPNLEAKFVAANTLIGLEKKEATLFDSEEIKLKERELVHAKHKIFGAKTVKTKRKYKEIVTDLRVEIAQMLQEAHYVRNEDAQQLAKWDMFNQNDYAPFFDSEWMFGVNSGFNIVIGNPPYLRVQGLRENYEEESKYYEKKYKSATGRFDFYVLFMECGYNLLTKDGVLSFIIPHKFINSDFGVGIRKLIFESNAMQYLVHFGSESIFENAKVYTCIIGLSHKNTSFRFALIKPKELNNVNYELISESRLANYARWDFQQTNGTDLMDKLKGMPYRLKDVVSVCSQGTVSMGDDLYLLEGHIEGDYFIGYSEQIKKEVRLEKEIMRPELKGEDVKRYEPVQNTYWLIYPHHQLNGRTVPYEEHEMRKNFPLTYEYLLPFKKELTEKKIRYKTNPKYWYTLHRSRDIQMFEQPKIITAEISFGCNMTFDKTKKYHATTCYTILLNDKRKDWTLAYLGIFNSKILWYFLSETGNVLRGGYFRFKTKYLEPFPIPELPDDIASILSKKVQFILDTKSTDTTADTVFVENEIDIIVYHLYGLTYDEILIVDPETPITREEYETSAERR